MSGSDCNQDNISTTPPRRRIGFSDPYTPEQFDALRTVFIRCAKGDDKTKAALFEEWWPEIRGAAKRLEFKIGAHDRRKKNPNIWRLLNGAVRRGDIRRLREKHPREAEALLYGAMLSGVIEPVQSSDYDKEYAALEALDPQDLARALEAAKAQPSVLHEEGKRRPGIVDQFAAELVIIYTKAFGTEPKEGWFDNYDEENTRKGPAIRFFTAALAPFPSGLTSHGISKLIGRAKNC